LAWLSFAEMREPPQWISGSFFNFMPIMKGCLSENNESIEGTLKIFLPKMIFSSKMILFYAQTIIIALIFKIITRKKILTPGNGQKWPKNILS
jgi:hypothetical protein